MIMIMIMIIIIIIIYNPCHPNQSINQSSSSSSSSSAPNPSSIIRTIYSTVGLTRVCTHSPPSWPRLCKITFGVRSKRSEPSSCLSLTKHATSGLPMSCISCQVGVSDPNARYIGKAITRPTRRSSMSVYHITNII